MIQNDCSETLAEMDQQFVLVSSSINEVIRSVLNFFFFHDKISQVQKSTKRH